MVQATRNSLKYAILIFSFLILMGFFLETLGVFSWAATEIHSSRSGLPIDHFMGPREVWIEVHDVSPAYGTGPLLEVAEVLDKHPDAYSQIVLLVIPNHGGSYSLKDHPDFVSALERLEEKGYILGVHGYAHPNPLRGREFMVDADKAGELLSLANDEFLQSGLTSTPDFAPPGWFASQEAAQVLRDTFQSIHYYYYMDAENSILPYPVHEYTWYGLNPGLWKAKLDYKRTKGVFRLSLHINAVNSEKNLKFLDDFLTYVEEEN